MRENLRVKVLDFLEQEIEKKHIPGAVIYVSYKGEAILQEVVGHRVVHPLPAPMQWNSVFDLASLTKVVATLPSVLKLMEEGDLRLDDYIHTFLPEFGKHGKDQVRIYHLLTHTSGLPAHRNYFLDGLSAEGILASIYEEKLEAAPGEKVVYSDLGFITLYKLIETVTREPFAEYVRKNILQPLAMANTSFNPVFARERYAATEFSKTLNDYKHGIVHDDNTESMGGISGHAGLFSTIDDLAKYSSMIENDGFYQGKDILSKAALDLTRKNYTSFDQEHRGLGWILKSPHNSSCGDFFSPQSYGHTGFTGTSIWFDPTIQLHVILLTNRVHFGRKDPIIKLRPRLHNIIRSHVLNRGSRHGK